nr:uncharacterized protein LOC106043644 isoform X3 [Anser cygnoides]
MRGGCCAAFGAKRLRGKGGEGLGVEALPLSSSANHFGKPGGTFSARPQDRLRRRLRGAHRENFPGGTPRLSCSLQGQTTTCCTMEKRENVETTVGRTIPGAPYYLHCN